jgi:hypothetical protein
MQFNHLTRFILVLCVSLLTACAAVDLSTLEVIGVATTNEKVDFPTLNSFADRSKAAYQDEDVIRTKFPATTRIADPGDTDGRYFLEIDDRRHTQTISVRGTASKIDIHDDIEMKVLDDRRIDIPVHSGFAGTTLNIYNDVTPYLKRNYKTYLTGHSLGGAVAALLAIYLMEDGYNVVSVVTFGQPKFTTGIGVQKLTSLPIVRVVDENDIVPMLPPTLFNNKLFGIYEHVGAEVVLLEGPNYSYLPTHDASRISIGELSRSMRLADLHDHHMDKYLIRLSSKTKTAVEIPYQKREKFVASAN